MKRTKPALDIDQWIGAEESRPRRGRCYSCSHASIKEIDAAAAHFIKRRNEGTTSIP